MKKLFFIIFIAIGTNAYGQSKTNTAQAPSDFVPAGYVVEEEIRGDLNKDNQADYVLIIKNTDKSKFVKDKYRGVLDRNRRGLIIAFKNQNQFELALENRNCFSSENEDGGAYYAPELYVSVNKGNLEINYAHGRYGYWTYKFRYQNSNFELIGYDSSEDRGPVVERSVSINLISKKIRIRKNMNELAQGDDEQFKETWTSFTLSKPIRLGEIANFDELDVESLLRPVK